MLLAARKLQAPRSFALSSVDESSYCSLTYFIERYTYPLDFVFCLLRGERRVYRRRAYFVRAGRWGIAVITRAICFMRHASQGHLPNVWRGTFNWHMNQERRRVMAVSSSVLAQKSSGV